MFSRDVKHSSSFALEMSFVGQKGRERGRERAAGWAAAGVGRTRRSSPRSCPSAELAAGRGQAWLGWLVAGSGPEWQLSCRPASWSGRHGPQRGQQFGGGGETDGGHQREHGQQLPAARARGPGARWLAA